MNQLQKYTWLIDTIRRAGKISHKDLSDRWSRNKDFSDGHELHRATFFSIISGAKRLRFSNAEKL